MFPLVFKILPILPIVVVLPTPFTPEINVALSLSFFSKKELFSKGFIRLIIYSFKIRFISVDKSLFGSIFLLEMISLISDAASTPTSDSIKNSSILFKFLSSISFFIIISFSPDVSADALFLKPILNLSKIPIIV